MVQNNLESKFVTSIEQDLQKTRLIVSQIMSQRRRSIASTAHILEGHSLIREILTDRSLDRFTADDIVKEEILPDFSNITLLMVLDADGNVLSSQGVDENATKSILQKSLKNKIINGRSALANNFHASNNIQIVGVPIFLREELLGALIVGSPLSQKVIDKVKALSGADIALFNGPDVFISSYWHKDENTQTTIINEIQKVITPKYRTRHVYNKKTNTASSLILLNNERWLSVVVKDKRNFLPDYVLAKSLDAQLSFVDDIKQDSLIIAAIGLFFGIILSVMFSRGVSRPIVALKQATDAVELEDFSYRTQIKSKDEFEQLGTAFNLMIEGLEERESMRGIMNRLMSKRIVDHLISHDIKTDGELMQASCLTIQLINFDAFSDTDNAIKKLALLNDCFTRLDFCINANQGLTNQYNNYTIQCLFGVPVKQDNHHVLAYQTALDCLQAIEIINGEYQRLNNKLHVRLSLFTGEMIAGNVGADSRASYSVMGELMNVMNEHLRSNAKNKSAITLNNSAYLLLNSKDKKAFSQSKTLWHNDGDVP